MTVFSSSKVAGSYCFVSENCNVKYVFYEQFHRFPRRWFPWNVSYDLWKAVELVSFEPPCWLITSYRCQLNFHICHLYSFLLRCQYYNARDHTVILLRGLFLSAFVIAPICFDIFLVIVEGTFRYRYLSSFLGSAHNWAFGSSACHFCFYRCISILKISSPHFKIYRVKINKR